MVEDVSELRKLTGNPHTKDWWWLLTPEERSWCILKLYNNHVLSAEEVGPLLKMDRLNTVFTHVLPFGLVPLIYKALPTVAPRLCLSGNKNRMTLLSMLGALPFIVAWRNLNPFRHNLTHERERLLNIAFKRAGGSYVINQNELLPRWMTEFEIHRRLRVLRGRKNGIWAGIFFPTEDHKAPEFPQDPWAPLSLTKVSQ